MQLVTLKVSGDFENGASENSENARENSENEYLNENGGLRHLVVVAK